jgi:hypothetical protein
MSVTPSRHLHARPRGQRVRAQRRRRARGRQRVDPAAALRVRHLRAFGNNTPDWIIWIAKIFPVRHFAVGLQAGFLGTTFQWTDVLVVAAWGVGGLLIAMRFFRWEPRAA